MFETLSQGFSAALEKLTKQGVLSEDEISTALREVRSALLEADVSLDITKRFIKSVGEKARGQAVTKSVTPGQQVIKIVHDELIKVLEGTSETSNALKIDNPPATILMVGLQGSGKTTTSAKLALRLQSKEKKKVLMASLDTRRPAAMEQLEILGKSNSIDTLPIVKNQSAQQITSRAIQQASLGGYDVIILDSAGRMQIDDELMKEIETIKDLSNPNETLLIADGLTGQEAVNVASAFNDRLNISGVVLTRMDGDGRGGAALSMVSTIGRSIKFIGTGEKVEALEEFHPDRIARRILGMGDIVSLVEKASETLEAEKAERSMRRFQKGLFNMNDLKSQLEQMQKMGGLKSLMGMMPGMGKLTKNLDDKSLDDSVIRRQIALIQSMTKKERASPNLLQASRKRRIALGAGVEVPELNKLIKMHRQMSDMMKRMGKMGGKGMLKSFMEQMSGKKDAPTSSLPDVQMLQKQFGSKLPTNLAGLNFKK
ncbi:MAG: signal recognition particle protein [Paracoccaceae bacterium]|nr:MAG: signal recognition particle protein [Alphaproteobacteria bacterium]|tara:strand:+ start:2225 stop:3679 length:1455 start_codon:yes stop_codon:yes gene_type:complete